MDQQIKEKFVTLWRKYFAGADRVKLVGCHFFLLVIIHDFHFKRVAFIPYETNSPTVVDTDAVLAFAISAQFFKVIRRWDAQVINGE